MVIRSSGAGRIDLRVLYAGNPDSERMQDFERFLNEHFAKVTTADYREFTPETANDYDVVIFDWTSIYPRDANGKVTFDVAGISSPKPPKLDRTFDRPVVMIGAAAGSIANQLQIAINWKCLCLENFAHDVEAKHAIFQGPRAVDLELQEQEKPDDYFVHPGTQKLGETIKVWKVQEKTFPEIDPGLVSSRENFVETPDAEVISGGINGKGPTSVAIGRHGNYLLWGFSGQPSEMTDSARSAFVNSICYIQKFDGKTPGPVRSTYGGRDSLLEQVYWLRSVSDAYISQQVERFKKMVAESPLPAKELEKVGDDPAAYFRKMFEPHAKQILEKLPANVREQCHDDTEQLIRYYTENLEYLRIRWLAVDSQWTKRCGKWASRIELPPCSRSAFPCWRRRSGSAGKECAGAIYGQAIRERGRVPSMAGCGRQHASLR